MSAIDEVQTELTRARQLFPAMNSPHEALATIMEEFDEYKDEVYRHNLTKARDTRSAQRSELIQLAAMAIRAIEDTIDYREDAYVVPCQRDASYRTDGIGGY